MSKENTEPSNLAKFFILVAVAVLFIGALFLFGHFSANTTTTNSFTNCETRFDSTPCPIPEQSYEELRKEDAMSDAILNEKDAAEDKYYEQQAEKMQQDIEEENRLFEQQLRTDGYN